MKVKVSNPSLSGEERTHITTDYLTGTTLNVSNSDNFSDNWYVVVGEPGQEQTEAMDIAGAPPTAQTITIGSALSFNHPISRPVYESQWNQISFERKPSGGSFAEISGSPFDIEWDNPDNMTLIVVSGGATTDTYRWRFYNAQQGTYSDYSDELLGTGIARNELGYVLTQVRRSPFAKGVPDSTLIDYANDFQTVVYEQMPKAWWFTKKGTAVSTAASDYDYSISSNWSDFLSMKILQYRYVSGSTDVTYPLLYLPLTEFYNLKADANETDDDQARYWTLLPPDSSSAKGYIGIHPTPETTANSIIPVYNFDLTALDSFSDDLVIPDAKAYTDYILYRICSDIKNDDGNAAKFDERVGRNLFGLKKRAMRQLGQPEFMRFRGLRGWARNWRNFGMENQDPDVRELYW